MPQRKGAKGTQQVKRKPKIIHAQIKSPVLLRKTILEASILSLENLKILKNIRQIKRRKDKLNKVVLSGGVFQNKLLLRLTLDLLSKEKFQVFRHQHLSCSDSGLSLGQAVIAGMTY